MSELKVDRIEPALANKITLSPSVSFENATGLVKFLVDSTSVTVTGPLKVGTIIGDVNTGTSRQILTSQGASLPPIWTDNFPIGGIILWSGNSATVPIGWTICDGDTVNGIATPNLRDKFVVGVGTNALKATGGYTDAVVVAHTHTISSTAEGNVYNVGCRVDCDDDGGWAGTSPSAPKLIITTNIQTAGESGVGKNLPPYYALYYIMKVS